MDTWGLDTIALTGLAAIIVLAVVIFGMPLLRIVASILAAAVIGYIGLWLLSAAGYDWGDAVRAWDWVVAAVRTSAAQIG